MQKIVEEGEKVLWFTGKRIMDKNNIIKISFVSKRNPIFCCEVFVSDQFFSDGFMVSCVTTIEIG